MAVDLDPVVDGWYKHLDKRLRFKVIAVDEDNAIVQIQKTDGLVEELEIDDWFEMDISTCEAPESWETTSDYVSRDEIVEEDWIIPSEAMQSEENQEVEEYWDEGFQEIDPFENNI